MFGKKNRNACRGFFLLIGLMVLAPCLGFAQTQHAHSGVSTLSISGTSTLHDWTIVSKEARYKAQFELDEAGQLEKILSLTFTLPAESLKSGQSAMDKNTYSTLNTDMYKNINFELLTCMISNGKAVGEGNLTVAGYTKRISLEGVVRVLSNKSISISGKKNLAMSELQIEPPSFMFGTVVTGDEIKIAFSFTLVPGNQ